MTGFLASVRSADEALMALAGGADIIDAKEPAAGALGRVERDMLRAIVAAIAGSCPVSATIDDLELRPDAVLAAVEATAECGAAIVKIGIFPGAFEQTIAALRAPAEGGMRLVAVLFADHAPDLSAIVTSCAAAGFFGVMLDTADKSAGRLTTHLDPSTLAGFTRLARGHGLISGLAGSLRRSDVATLAPLGADYLGFRSALTAGDRASRLDSLAIAAVRHAIDHGSLSNSATAMAGAMSIASDAKPQSARRSVSSNPR
jgi:(5-formylfuran-3-yl)methyl phosphate synthase